MQNIITGYSYAQPLIRKKDLGDHDIKFSNILGKLMNEYDIGCSLLMLLDKLGIEKDEIRDSNSQLKCHINDLKTSMCAQKESLISYSHSIETDEKSNSESNPIIG